MRTSTLPLKSFTWLFSTVYVYKKTISRKIFSESKITLFTQNIWKCFEVINRGFLKLIVWFSFISTGYPGLTTFSTG